MNGITEIRQNVDDFEKFKNGIKKFFDKVDEGGQEVSTINNCFSFLSKYGYKASCGFGKGKLSHKPFVVFIRTDSGYDSASKGVYCRVNIERGTDNVSVEINESETNKIQYKAQQDCEQYNKGKLCEFKRNDLDNIVKQVLKDMEWFAKLPLESIKDNVVTITKPQYDANLQPDIDKTKGENMANPPLNQILYGPPGTGKTYNTINKALEILGVETQGKSRAELKAQFDESRQNGQIEFITFHQSFSYEEFVEGIKPKFINSNESAESSKMEYEIKSGIFKQICEKALKNLEYSQKDEAELKKESEVNNLFEAFIEHIQSEQENGGEYILKQNAEKDKNWLVVLLDWGNYKVIKIFSHSGYLEKYPVFLNGDKIKAYYSDFKVDNSFKIPSNENRTGYIDTHRFYTAFFKKMQEFESDWQDSSNDNGEIDFNQKALEPHILIIDEINRGNISKILGELITLIEPSKRIGASNEEKARSIGNESLKVTLPYSNETFGVPKNLYIIGTMNTADRSIALLDTALRRRFEFVEMMPQPELLKNIWIVKDTEQRDNENLVIPENRIEELDKYMGEKSNCLYKILDSINNRIEFLLDREHTIGHAFFFEKAKFYQSDEYGEWYELTLESLKEIFVKKIIPLLQEYFYDDYAKIDAVLNGNKMIEITEVKVSSLFSKKDKDLELDDKKIYKITPFENEIWDNPQTYKNIYVGKESNSQEISENEQE